MSGRKRRADEETTIQVRYLKVISRYPAGHKGAKKETYESQKWTISKAQAGRIMADVDTWTQEQKDLLMAIYYEGREANNGN